MTESKTNTPTSADLAADTSATRRKRLGIVGGVIVLTGIAWGVWHVVQGDDARTTDDAYVNGHVVAITPQVAGAISQVFVDNADRVLAGQTLAEIDASDAHIALDAAQAELGQTVRRVRALFAADARAAATVALRQVELDRARSDLSARQQIVAQGAVTQEEARHAGDAVRMAEAALQAAVQARAEAQAHTQGTTVDTHPDVLAATERVRAAALALERTTIRSPVAGMIAQRTVQLGKRVGVGDRLMAVVPLDQVWVDANFKEVQLDGVCSGQPAQVKADLYGSRVTYRGTVDDIEAGSGAAFSLLPAQNATGNWIKVVQRVPVRIRLNPEDVARHPLRIGMSTEVEIDTRQCATSKGALRARATEKTEVYAAQKVAADRSATAAATAAQNSLRTSQ